MLVFRVEHKQAGVGPYSASCESKWADDYHCKKTGRPSPYDEGISRYITKSHYFGFADLEQLEGWFTVDEQRKLDTLGFAVFAYEIDEAFIVRGAKQVAMLRVHATRIGEMPLW